MKKSSIAKIVMYSILTIVLIGILIFALNTGFGFGDLLPKNDKPSSYENEYKYKEQAADYNNISIDWVSGEVEVRTYDGTEISIVEYSGEKLAKKDKLKLDGSGGTLKIEFREDLPPFWISFLNWDIEKKLIVQIPKSMELSDVSVKSVSAAMNFSNIEALNVKIGSTSGDITVSDVIARELTLNNSSGEISADNVICGEGKVESVSGDNKLIKLSSSNFIINTVSGKVNVVGNLLKIKGSTVSGDVKVSTGLMPDDVDLGSISGTVDFIIPENDGFVIEKSSISGGFVSKTVSLETIGKLTYYKNSNSESFVKLNTTSGSMGLEKREKDKEAITYDALMQSRLDTERKKEKSKK